MVNIRPPAHVSDSFLFPAEIAIKQYPVICSREKKKSDIGKRKKKSPSATCKMFHLGEDIKRKSSKAVPLHSLWIAPPVTQVMLSAVLSCPASTSFSLTHTSPGSLGKKLLRKNVFKGFFKRTNLINCRSRCWLRAGGVWGWKQRAALSARSGSSKKSRAEVLLTPAFLPKGAH